MTAIIITNYKTNSCFNDSLHHECYCPRLPCLHTYNIAHSMYPPPPQSPSLHTRPLMYVMNVLMATECKKSHMLLELKNNIPLIWNSVVSQPKHGTNFWKAHRKNTHSLTTHTTTEWEWMQRAYANNCKLFWLECVRLTKILSKSNEQIRLPFFSMNI